MLNVISKTEGPVAAISLGFDANGSMPGPFLDPINPQAPYAEELLHLVATLVLTDSKYVARLERHYNMMKDKLGRPAPSSERQGSEQPWWKRKRKKPKRFGLWHRAR